jgi:hypothetical protein
MSLYLPAPSLAQASGGAVVAPASLASQLRYSEAMKTATIPSIRVEQAFRDELEASLREGETLSQFVESALRASLRRRTEQSAFIARGIAALEHAKSTGETVDSEVVLKKLERKLEQARRERAARAAARR